MSSQSLKSSENNTFVRPEMFYIRGLKEMSFANCFYIFLFIMYIFAVFSNVFVILLIYLDQSLHNPKYLAVVHLTLVDLGTTTAVIPKLIEMFLFNSSFISYEACLADMFFVHFFNAMQSVSLLILAYDRFLAICFPLQYHSINTNSRMVGILVSLWMFTAVIISITVLLITRLSFCQSTVVNSFFCDFGPVYFLACNDIFPNEMIGWFNTAVFLFLPLCLILCSYIFIGVTLFKMTSTDGKQKALKTCISHIILVVIFYVPVAITYILSQFLDSNIRILNNSLSSTIPSTMNPIIYTLKTDEMKAAMKKVLKIKFLAQ
ncbi:putative gustatory receptor clone PTE01 [Erpetoichthys calabaricus]|uniref:putative gustatory receptor clone PTE01 n=1 Tax=Erpetoichthys calabaricus TaxID=27687 RepID=UPI0010A0BB58|nr:putative gustatory receptor clone PTE01 [Erpetoichthys calabaricus]